MAEVSRKAHAHMEQRHMSRISVLRFISHVNSGREGGLIRCLNSMHEVLPSPEWSISRTVRKSSTTFGELHRASAGGVETF
jgi:hypothetical protein